MSPRARSEATASCRAVVRAGFVRGLGEHALERRHEVGRDPELDGDRPAVPAVQTLSAAVRQGPDQLRRAPLVGAPFLPGVTERIPSGGVAEAGMRALVGQDGAMQAGAHPVLQADQAAVVQVLAVAIGPEVGVLDGHAEAAREREEPFIHESFLTAVTRPLFGDRTVILGSATDTGLAVLVERDGRRRTGHGGARTRSRRGDERERRLAEQRSEAVEVVGRPGQLAGDPR